MAYAVNCSCGLRSVSKWAWQAERDAVKHKREQSGHVPTVYKQHPTGGDAHETVWSLNHRKLEKGT